MEYQIVDCQVPKVAHRIQAIIGEHDYILRAIDKGTYKINNLYWHLWCH
jgi:predicted secreted protein